MRGANRRILNAIEELESNGLATRTWAVAGLCLGMCGECEEWTGSGCRENPMTPGKFGELLCDAKFFCDRWRAIHKGREGE